MDSKVDAAFIRAERGKRGWSQEQLAAAAGLGIRTIQRIESSGRASGESAKCLAAVFEVPLSCLFVESSSARRPWARYWAAAAALCVALASSVFLISRANASDVAMWVVVNTEVTGESRMHFEVVSGRQTEIKLENDLRLLLTPTLRKDGTILVAAELHEWNGREFILASKPRVLLNQGAETGLQLRLSGGRSAAIRIIAREA
jgi:DNA-binding XRE family transcriptional regulator